MFPPDSVTFWLRFSWLCRYMFHVLSFTTSLCFPRAHYVFSFTFSDSAVTLNPTLLHFAYCHWGQGPKYPLGTWWNIEITVNMWLQYAQWSNSEYILNISCYVTQICPAGTCWVHFECPQLSDSNVPTGQITGYIFNIHKNLTPICPVGKVWPYFQ